jgi:predicted PurR-regulated permease PerM
MAELLKKHWRLLLLLTAGVVLLVLAWAWRGALLPFIIGLVLAYLMLPGVNWLAKRLPPRHKWKDARRVIAILIAFIITLAVIGLLLSFCDRTVVPDV